MRRNLKALGLALVAVFALSAVAASAAWATEATFTSGSDATTLTAKALTNQVFTGEGLSVTCKSLTLDNSTMGTDVKEITVEPTFGKTPAEGTETECEFVQGANTFPLMFHTNGCHLLFTAGNKVDGTVHITCPTGKEIEATIFVLGKFRNCLDIPEQTPTVPTVDYTNGTEVTGGKNVWDVTVKSTIEGFTYTKTGSCGTGTFNDLKYTGEATVWGENAVSEPVNVTWDPET